MDYKIKTMVPFKVIGFQKVFDSETSYTEIPKFWKEFCEKYMGSLSAGNAPANPYEKAIVDNRIGEYGVCVGDLDGSKFHYLIAGKYTGGDVPEGMTVYEFPQYDWAVFDCYGPMPKTLQDTNTKVFKEWLPGNPDYEFSGNASIEWYDYEGDPSAPDYHSAIWISVMKK